MTKIHTFHRELNATLLGKKIICESEKCSKPHLVSSSGLHNYQVMTISGKKRPAIAVISTVCVWVKK